jgi:mono/diheme cytochrome c family protein
MRIALVALVAPGLLALLAASGACSKEPAAPASGAQLFAQQCAMCHGDDARGGSLGPTLHGKQSHWTRDALVAYLKDPVGVAKQDPRLVEQGRQYSLPMPTYKMLPETALEALADHVLALP